MACLPDALPRYAELLAKRVGGADGPVSAHGVWLPEVTPAPRPPNRQLQRRDMETENITNLTDKDVDKDVSPMNFIFAITASAPCSIMKRAA